MAGMFEWNDASSDAAQTYKEVGALMAANAVVSTGLGALAAYNHAKDPANGGMPAIGGMRVFGADALVGAGATVLAIFAGDVVGSLGQTLLLGAATAGVGSAFNGLGSVLGVKMFDAMKPAAPKGLGVGALSQEAADAFAEYGQRKAA